MRIKKKKVLFGSLLIALFALVAFTPLVVSAGLFDGLFGDDTEDIVSFLQEHSDWLQYGSFLTIILHEVGWIFVKIFYILTSFLEGLVPQSLSLLGFLEDAGLDSIAAAVINDLVVALMVLTLVFLGFKTVIAKEPPNFKSVGVNIFISAFLILGLPTLMNTMEDISMEFYDSTQTGNNNGKVSSLAWGLVQDNTADLFYVADNGFDLIKNGDTNSVKNALTTDIFLSTNLTELVTPDVVDDLDSSSNEVNSLKYTLSNDGQGNYTAIEIDSSLLSWFSDSFDSGYFRYPAKFFPIIIGLIALSVAYLFTLFVFITTIIEIGIKRVVALFVFATDLESGQRTKMVLKDIMNAFLLIAFNGLNLKLYTLFLSYLGTTDINLILYIIAVVSATFVLIKGSNTIMRYFGIDVGVKDGFAQLAGAFVVGKALSSFAGKGKVKGNKKAVNSDAKDRLNQNAEENSKSINDPNNKERIGGGLKKSINAAGKTVGYMRERGLSGFAEDAVKGTGEKIANNLNNKVKSVSDGAKGIKDSWEGGVEEGELMGLGNQIKWNKDKGNQSQEENGDELPSYEDSGFIKSNSNSSSQNSSTQSNEDKGINPEGNSEENQLRKNQSNEEILTNMKLNDAMQPKNTDATGILNMETKHDGSSDTASNQAKMNGKDQSNEEILTNIKLNDAMQPKNIDAEGNLNMRTQADNVTNEQEPIQQSVVSDMRNSMPLNQKGEVTADMKTNGDPFNQKGDIAADIKTNGDLFNQKGDIAADIKTNGDLFNQKGDIIADMKVNSSGNEIQKGVLETAATSEKQVMQRVLQQVEQTSFSNPESAKQNIIQAVQQDSYGSNDTKQKVIQEIERSSIATPEQVQQNVQQVLSNARLPQDMQTSVQRVIQEVQHSDSSSPETIKNKVIEEIEQADFGTKEPLKQMVMQQVERSFSATPEQMEQNIKQTFSATRSEVQQANETTSSKVVQDKVTKNQVKNQGEGKYFGSLLGNYFESEPVKPKKSSRFDKFYKK